MPDHRNATWRSYQVISNIGVKKEVLNYTGGADKFFTALSSPHGTNSRAAKVIRADGSILVAGIWTYWDGIGTRPALYQ